MVSYEISQQSEIKKMGSPIQTLATVNFSEFNLSREWKHLLSCSDGFDVRVAGLHVGKLLC